MITVSIDLRKIDQSKCKSHPNGAKYCELILLESKPNNYGNDYMVVQGLPKADRDAGQKGAILGNGKNLQRKNNAPPPPPATASDGHSDDGDVPF